MLFSSCTVANKRGAIRNIHRMQIVMCICVYGRRLVGTDASN